MSDDPNAIVSGVSELTAVQERQLIKPTEIRGK